MVTRAAATPSSNLQTPQLPSLLPSLTTHDNAMYIIVHGKSVRSCHLTAALGACTPTERALSVSAKCCTASPNLGTVLTHNQAKEKENGGRDKSS